MSRLIDTEHFQGNGVVVGKWPLRTEKRGLASVFDALNTVDPVIGHTYQVNKPDKLGLNGIETYHIEADGSQGKLDVGDEVVLHGSQIRIGLVRVPLTRDIYAITKK